MNFYSRKNNAISIYICESSDGKELVRKRKFDQWFQEYNDDTFIKIDKNLIDKNYNKSMELFETTDIINIVFKSDFSDDNKYYYDNIRFKNNNYKVDSNRKINELYKLRIKKNKKKSK